MALKMRDDHNGKNDKREKEDQTKPEEGGQVTNAQHVNGVMNQIGDPLAAPTEDRQAQKRIVHNEVEKKRKDRIKQGITKIGSLLPLMTEAERKANGNLPERNTFSILEKAAEYIQELKEKSELFLQEKGDFVQAEEIRRLKAELSAVQQEKQRLEIQLKAAGPAVDFSANWTSKKCDGFGNSLELTDISEAGLVLGTSTDGQEGPIKKKGHKSRRKNTISAQLEEKSHQNAINEQKTDSNDTSLSSGDQNLLQGTNLIGLQQNAAINPQFLNAAMLAGGVQQGQGQFMMPSMNILNAGGLNPAALNPSMLNTGALNSTLNQSLIQNLGMDRCNGMMPYMSPNTNLSAFSQNVSMADGFGLLQMAMRDAGIAASSLASSTQSQATTTTSAACTTSAAMPVNKDSGMVQQSSTGTASPLHTLAAVASDAQAPNTRFSSGQHSTANPQHLNGPLNTNPTQGMNMNMPIMTPNGILQTINPNMGIQLMPSNPTMPFNIMQNGALGGITMMPQQQGQIIYLNDQGVPVISNVPVPGMDCQTQNPQMIKQTQGNIQNGPKDPQKSGQDSLSEMHGRDQMFQLPANPIQQQGQFPSQDMLSQQGQNNQINMNRAQNPSVLASSSDPNVILQAQQQFNQHILQSTQLPGMTSGAACPSTNLNSQNLLGNTPKSDTSSNNPPNGDNLMLPVSQTGNLLTVNQSNPSAMQLPSALILPNGQIIPVVTQPQLLMNQNQQTASNNMNPCNSAVQDKHAKTMENNGQAEQGVKSPMSEISTCSSDTQTATTRQTGLLMTTNTIVTAPNRPVSTSVAALSTTVVPTTVTGSIMSTQIQKQPVSTSQANGNNFSQNTPTTSETALSKVTSEGSESNSQMLQAMSMPVLPNAGNLNQLPGSNPMTMFPNNPLVNNGAIVLTLPNNTPGQAPTSVLVDPITMQVLGTLPPPPIQPQQPPPPQTQPKQASLPQSTPSNSERLKPPSNDDSGKKSNKKGSHRALKPKPPSSKSHGKKSQKNPSNVSSNTTTATTSESKEASSSESPQTDILAQATESIFSDISPSLSNFYNPANEDNPLHIDTSAGDTEEDAVAVSPKKDRLQNSQAVYNKQPSSAFDLTDPSTSPYHFVESPPVVKEVAKKSKSKKPSGGTQSKATGNKKGSKKNTKEGGSKKANKEKPADTKVPDDKQKDNNLTVGKQAELSPFDQLQQKPPAPDTIKKTKPGKVHVQEQSQIDPIQSTTDYQSLFTDEEDNKNLPQSHEPPEVIPQTINFTENELSDVLDQVEKFGTPFPEETAVPATPTGKKSKSRKTKGQTSPTDGDHSTKKKKKTSHVDSMSMNTSLNMENILASMTTPEEKHDSSSLTVKKGPEPIQELSSPIDEPALFIDTFSPDSLNKNVSTISSQESKNNELSDLSGTPEQNLKTVTESLSNPLHISTNPPLLSPNINQVVRSLENQVKSPSFGSPTLNISPLQRSTEPKSGNDNHSQNESSINDFTSFLMPDTTESNHVQCGPQSLPCLTNDASATLQRSLSESSPSCKVSSDQQQPSTSPTISNVTSSDIGNHQRLVRSASSSLDGSASHCAQSISASINSQLTYSAESLFSPASSCSQITALPDIRTELPQPSVSAAPPLMHPSNQVNHPPNSSPETSRAKTSIYSAENFVQTSMTCESQETSKQPYNRPHNEYPHSSSNRGNHMNMNSESFNFSNIASNVSSNNRGKANTNQSSTVTSTASNAFSFSLAGNSDGANNNFSAPLGHHQFPFYPLHPSVTSSQGGTESTPDTSRKSEQVDPVFPPFPSNERSSHFQGTQVNSLQGHNNLSQGQPFANFSSPPNPSRDNLFHNQPQLTPPSEKVNPRSLSSNSNVRKQKDSASNRAPPVHNVDQHENINNMQRSMFVSTGLPSFYTPNRQQMSGPSPLETPPLHHLPQTSVDSRMTNSYQTSIANPNAFSPEFSSVRIENSSVQISNQNYNQHQQTHQPSDASKHSRSKNKQSSDHMSRRHAANMLSMDSQMTPRGNQARQSSQQHDHRPSHNAGSHTPTPNTHLEQQQQSAAPQQNRSQKTSAKQSKSQQQSRSKKSKQSFNQEMDSQVLHPMFDTSQGISPYFGIPNRTPPPSRSGQPDAPTYVPHFLGPSSRGLPNAVHKNPPDLGGTFNPLFSSVRPQTSLGLNFQPGFGMNPVHGGHASTQQMKSHPGAVSVTQPMSSFNLTNIFSDVNNCAQSNGGLNLSPMKFPHGNSIIPPQPGMEHNSLQHHHNPGMLYHNRTPGPPPVLHNAMSINSLIGHNHPGMGQINNTMGQTFHGYGHPSSFPMHHLNFAMPDH